MQGLGGCEGSNDGEDLVEPIRLVLVSCMRAMEIGAGYRVGGTDKLLNARYFGGMQG